MHWYERTFGNRYLELYGHRNDSEARRAMPLVRRAAAQLGRFETLRVLDLACGAGRYSRLLAADGCSVVGLDLSAELLKTAADNIPEVGSGQRPHFVRADMRAVPFDRIFDLALNMFTSFGYFESDRENASVLTELARALKPGGAFLIDYMNRPWVLASLVARDRFMKHGITVEQCRWISPDGLRVEKEVTVRGDQGQECYRESVRLYSRSEMEGMLDVAELKVYEVFGDYDSAPHNENSPRLILSGRKTA